LNVIALVGHETMHSPHLTQVNSPIGRLRLNQILVGALYPCPVRASDIRRANAPVRPPIAYRAQSQLGISGGEQIRLQVLMAGDGGVGPGVKVAQVVHAGRRRR
jgi:hypothetical protein